jgi:hypothetical protein
MNVVLVVFIAFLVFAIVGVLRLWLFVRNTHISVRRSGEADALHIETPIGNLDLQPQDHLDPRLESFVVYPGAQFQVPDSPDYVARGDVQGKQSSSVTATYWTPDLSGKVLEFYRSALLGWSETREWLGGGMHAYEFADQGDAARSIRVRSAYGGTAIENTITHDSQDNDGKTVQ